MLKHLGTFFLALALTMGGIAVADSVSSGGLRIFDNPVSGGTNMFRMNNAGSPVEAGLVSSTGAWTLGPGVTGNGNGVRHTVSGGLIAGNVTSTALSGSLFLSSNAYINANAAAQGRTDTTTGGTALLLSNRSSDSDWAFIVYGNQAGDTTTTAADVLMYVTQEGLVGIPTSGTGNLMVGGGTVQLNDLHVFRASYGGGAGQTGEATCETVRADSTCVACVRGDVTGSNLACDSSHTVAMRCLCIAF